MKSYDVYHINELPEELANNLEKEILFEEIYSTHEFTPLMREFNKEYFGIDYKDNSILLYDKKNLKLFIPAYCNTESLSYFSASCKVFYNFNSKQECITAYKYLNKKLKKILVETFNKATFYSDSYLVKGLYDHFTSAQVCMRAGVNLSLTEDDIFSNIRKSYKSLINWGKKNLKLIVVDKNNPLRDAFDIFKKLHFDASGKSTRTDKSWDIQFKQISAGEAFLIIAYYEDKPVSGVYILHGKKTAMYGVAAADRELMKENLPLTHWPLLKAIFYAKEMGLDYFNFGILEYESDDSKLYEIIKFKRGFCSEIVADSIVEFSKFKDE